MTKRSNQTGTGAGAASTPSQVAPAHPAPDLANCDECCRIYPVGVLWQVHSIGLLCERCADELRDQGLHT